MLNLDVRETLRFLDEKPAGSRCHATAVTQVCGEDLGLALLRRYLSRDGAVVERLIGPCTQGTKKGRRLDGWIHLRHDATEVLYQVEVKSWSAHALGGTPLPIDAPKERQSEYRIARWKGEWNGFTFIKENVRKVLTPMRPPEGCEGLPIKPLVCYWWPIHPDGLADPFFMMPLTSEQFSEVSFFSMSNYLRGCGEAVITLDLPNTAARMGWLASMFRPAAVAQA
ncbi:MAG: hypothetical protein WB626_03425 [Bacteroidota bacterium]